MKNLICFSFSLFVVACCLLPAQGQYLQNSYGQRAISRWPYPTTQTQTNSLPGSAYATPNGYVYQNGVPCTYVGGPPLPHVHDYRGPSYYAPVPAGNGYFNFSSNGNQLTYWRAPSGYYYPWYHYQGVPNYTYQPIYYSSGAYAQALPAMSVVFNDMGKFLDDAKTNGKLNDVDYDHLKLRLSDLMGKEEELRMSNGGTLSSDDESGLRNDLESLSREISYRVQG